MATANPYADAFDDYWRAGWRGILPLPARRKKTPPDGYTGHDGIDASYADCATWAEDGERNICLRMPRDVVGIDVDHYDGKTGGDTLAGLVEKYGALPPTWLSTSRDDGISGIRLYRIPAGASLPTRLPGIEFIQWYHRYAVVWPSLHPEGRTYRWIDETSGTTVEGAPAVADIPHLPAAWVAGLATESKQAASKVDLDGNEAAATLAGMPRGEPCEHMLKHAGKALAGGDRHDSYNEAVLAVVGAGRRGCPGAATVVERLRAAFLAEVTAPGSSQRSKPEALAEWSRGILGALSIVVDEPQGTVCPDEVYLWMADQESGDPKDDDQTVDPPPEPTVYDRAVARRVAELRIAEDAKAIIAAEKAGQAPPLAGVDLAAFLAQPDEEERYRVDGLWPAEGRVLLPAPAKAGKTTLVIGNLIPALVDGGDFLGRFAVTPVRRRVVLFNLEVGERTLRGWARKAGVAGTDKVTVVNLRGRVGALGLGSDAGRARLSAFLRDQDAEVVILDPLAPALASLGLDENVNADVALFFSWWSQALGDAGVVDDLICHHIGHGGERSRGASRLLDEPDAIWTLTKRREGGEDDVFGPCEQRYLQAYGRDVEQPIAGLEFDQATGRLTLVDGGPEAQKVRTFRANVVRIVAEAGPDGISHRDLVNQAHGVGKERRPDIVRKMVGTDIDGTQTRPGQWRYFPLTVPSVPDVPDVPGNGAAATVPRSPLRGTGAGTGHVDAGSVDGDEPAFPGMGNA